MSWTVEWDESSASGSSVELTHEDPHLDQLVRRALDMVRNYGHVRVRVADGRLAAVLSSVQGTIVLTDGEAVEGALVDAVRTEVVARGGLLRRIS